MDGNASFTLLMASTATIAIIHSLAPDHWMPLASMARARNWSRNRMVGATLLCGVGHVGSSILLGLIGLALGLGLSRLTWVESQRGQMSGMLLIGFGLAYGIWGLKKALAKHTDTAQDENRRSLAVWALVILFVLGPCEPLIPLLFLAFPRGWHAVIMVTTIFSALTLLMMVVQTALAREGLGLIRASGFEHWSHAAAGLVIASTGALVMALGI